ncbi:hypothetical protein P152DRAFT_455016 [Eremomyces bilateralis CBS 781.70]|uniref:HNH nuclease domain-containing protein n=1 Tax=Eremomyces bilateralis CBS 781.70 TaxID=1392243 RepID=A0A6G1GB48_9PEZI|nr:uncharacterized protein P152DRAFT_455016 [Eremomyces bilateralis CBS 781.70]KAF1815295.1 hypothetical protein P152DRAFT_455016 [Eremomyces bilateralis CBS 781.70]
MSSPSPITTSGSPEASNPLNPSQGRAIPPLNRSFGRDIHIYDANDPNAVLGGLVLTAGVTNANFYSMIEILFIFASPFYLRDEDKTKIEKDDHPLKPGKYYIVSDVPLQVNIEPWLIRTISRASGTHVSAFREAVRLRDRRCVISGETVPILAGIELWDGFEAAHIFPLAHEGHWINHSYGRWITIQPAKGGSINSVQNGLLLDSAVHQLFDAYAISINPDDKYKVVAFRPTSKNIAGKHLDQEHFARCDAPIDSLLRWHFRQAVLANMRGSGEPVFEHDFPPGSDIAGDILRGPKAAERMQFELFSRLGAQMKLFK